MPAVENFSNMDEKGNPVVKLIYLKYYYFFIYITACMNPVLERFFNPVVASVNTTEVAIEKLPILEDCSNMD